MTLKISTELDCIGCSASSLATAGFIVYKYLTGGA